jgi:hypothetical protein
MRCHGHPMHNTIFKQHQKVKIICKTALLCKIQIKEACCVNDTTCTQHSWCMQGQCNCMHHACKYIYTACTLCIAQCMWCNLHSMQSIKLHAQSTNSSWALASFKGNIYQKHLCMQIVLPHHYKLYVFNGWGYLTNNYFLACGVIYIGKSTKIGN